MNKRRFYYSLAMLEDMIDKVEDIVRDTTKENVNVVQTEQLGSN